MIKTTHKKIIAITFAVAIPSIIISGCISSVYRPNNRNISYNSDNYRYKQNLTNIKLDFANIGRCEFTEILGSVYRMNRVRSITVDINNRTNLRRKLDDLCQQFGYTEGINANGHKASESGVRAAGDDYEGLWENSAGEHLFGRFGKFMEMPTEDKMLLAQCIEFMYQNRNSDEWRGDIKSCLHILSQHGGHCYWRTQAITNAIYTLLSNHTQQVKSDVGISDTSRDWIEVIITALKDKIVGDATNLFNQALMSGKYGYSVQNEPLCLVHDMTREIRRLLNIPDGGSGDVSKLTVHRFFNEVTKTKYLIERSDEIIKGMLPDAVSGKIFREINIKPISFQKYCYLSGKSESDREKLLVTVDNGDDEILKDWVEGRRDLPIIDLEKNDESIYWLIGDLCNYSFEKIGCYELEKVDGLRFIALCEDNGYLCVK